MRRSASAGLGTTAGLILSLIVVNAAVAAPGLINNGLAPPNDANVIQDATHKKEGVRTRNEGCPAPPYRRCKHLQPTESALVEGGVARFYYINDTSIGTVDGGMAGTANAYHRSELYIESGILGRTAALDDATVVMTGGIIGVNIASTVNGQVHLYGGLLLGTLAVLNDSEITVYGSNFHVDGSPVPYGMVQSALGQLTGTLSTGHPLDSRFHRQARTGAEIVLVFVPRDIAIDILPGLDVNNINVSKNRPIAVAILGEESLDVNEIDVSTLEFGPEAALQFPGRAHYRDVDGDGLLDLVARFRINETGLMLGDDEACLTGELFDGSAIEGCDSVSTFD